MKPRDEFGFTAIELLIAISILAIISILVTTSFQRTISVRNTVVGEDNLDHAMRIVLRYLNDEISQAFLVTKPRASLTKFVGEDGQDIDRLTFNSYDHFRYIRNSHESDQNVVRYEVEFDENEEIKNLVRYEKTIIEEDKEVEAGFESHVLASNITRFNLRYCDGAKGEWHDNWDSTQVEFRNRLPIAVEATVGIKNDAGSILEFRNYIIVESEYSKKLDGNFVMKGCKVES